MSDPLEDLQAHLSDARTLACRLMESEPGDSALHARAVETALVLRKQMEALDEARSLDARGRIEAARHSTEAA